MSIADIDNIFKTFRGEVFRFRCHKDIRCFNKCCSKLHLVLTPYDIMRLKNRLAKSSDIFLDEYTVTEIKGQSRFPVVRLKMSDNFEESCPFVTESGCKVYDDRPGACRLYPIGRASAFSDKEGKTREKFFLVKETHCLGFEEDASWTIKEWLKHEGVYDYYLMNDLWLEILSSPKTLGPGDQTRKLQMFFMASYNLDVFRRFIFESGFFGRFDIHTELQTKIAEDDAELMKFGFLWLKFSLFGEKTIKIKE